jgi:hypothetical protein
MTDEWDVCFIKLIESASHLPVALFLCPSVFSYQFVLKRAAVTAMGFLKS